MQAIYLDNAATSFPKPAGVSDSMKQYMDEVGATINRSVYGAAQTAGLVTLQLREALARFYHFPDPDLPSARRSPPASRASSETMSRS